MKHKDKISSDNRLIAEFMGYYYRENFRGRTMFWHSADSKVWGEGTWTPAFELENAEYHISWDWLYPVLEKIQQLGYPYLISDETVSIYKVWQEEFISHFHGKPTIEAAFKCVVNFIKKYNGQEI